GAEYLLVVAQAVTSLAGQKQRRHGPDVKLAMRLLEHRAHVDQRVDILALARVSANRRLLTPGEKFAPPADGGAAGGGIAHRRKGEQAKASIRSGDVAEVNRLGVGETDDRRRMKARADNEAFGEMLVDRFTGQDGRTVVRGGSGRVAP